MVHKIDNACKYECYMYIPDIISYFKIQMYSVCSLIQNSIHALYVMGAIKGIYVEDNNLALVTCL